MKKTEQEKVWAVVPAGGIGARMRLKIPKQYIQIEDRPILHHTLHRICECRRVDGVVAGIRQEDVRWRKNPFSHNKFRSTFEAGTQRVHTVFNGLNCLRERLGARDSDWVLVHDAVRACLRQSDLLALIECAKTNRTGAVLGTPLVDTLKSVGDHNRVQRTIDRTGLWLALTPQVFRLGDLFRGIELALDSGNFVTDESMAMEHCGIFPEIIEGHPSNIKLTVSGDLPAVELFLLGSGS